MLKSIDNATVNKVIDLAEAAEAARHRKDEQYTDPAKLEDFEAAIAFSEQENQLRSYLRGLSENELAELAAVMWLGRERSMKKEDFYEKVAYAMTTLEEMPEYIAGKGPLGKYLRDGLKKLR
jgi:hypothetical protein